LYSAKNKSDNVYKYLLIIPGCVVFASVVATLQ